MIRYNRVTRVFSITPDQKDVDRAETCPSAAKASAMASSIKDVDKLLRRSKAFIDKYGLDSNMSEPFLNILEAKLSTKEISDADFFDVVGVSVNDYFRSKQPKALKEWNDWIKRLAESQLRIYKSGWSERDKLTKEFSKLLDKFKEWLKSSNSFHYTESEYVYDPFMVIKYQDKGNPHKYRTHNYVRELIPDGELAKAIADKTLVSEKAIDKLKRLSDGESIISPANPRYRLDAQTEFYIAIPRVYQDEVKKVFEKYKDAYPNSLWMKDGIINIQPVNLSTVDIFPDLNRISDDSLKHKLRSSNTDQEMIDLITSSLKTDVNQSAENFIDVLDSLIKEVSKIMEVGKKVDKSWVYKSTKDLTPKDLKVFPGLIYVDTNPSGFAEQGFIKTLYTDAFKSHKSMITLGIGDISIGGNNCSFEHLKEWDDYVINPFYVARASNDKIAKLLKDLLTKVGHPEAYKASTIKLAKSMADTMMDAYREAGILRSFSINYNTETKSFSVQVRYE